jgi:hypothetical protein
MVNKFQYPDKLKVTTITGGTTSVDGNGDVVLIPGVSSVSEFDCRAESPQVSSKNTTDGIEEDVHYVIYGTVDIPRLSKGTSVEIIFNDGHKEQGQVIKMDKTEFHVMIWI